MSGPSSIRNLISMRGRRKGGLKASTAIKEPSSKTLRGQAAAFLEHLAARAYSQGSIDSQLGIEGLPLVGGYPESRLTRRLHPRHHFERYQHHLHHYRSPRTKVPLVVNTQLARLGCVRRFFAWLCRSGIIPANPAADLDLPRKQARHLPKTLSAEEINRLLALPNPADPFGLRDRCILELFYTTGIRL